MTRAAATMLSAWLWAWTACVQAQTLAVDSAGLTWDPPFDGYVLRCRVGSGPFMDISLVPWAVLTLPQPHTPGQQTCCVVRWYVAATAQAAERQGDDSNAVCDVAQLPGTPNLLPGGDFEGGISGMTGSYSGTHPTFTLVTDDVPTGQALLISGSGVQYGYWLSNAIPVEPGASYQVTLMVRTTRAAVSVWALHLDATGRQIRSVQIASLSGTQEWQQLEGRTNAASGVAQLRLQVRAQGTDIALLIDNVTLKKSP